MPRLTKLNSISNQIVHKTAESIQKIQGVQISISSYFSTSISEDRTIPSNTPPKTEKQVEAYEYWDIALRVLGTYSVLPP